MEKGVIVTSIYLDYYYLITGDNHGIISIRNIKDGSLLRNLNTTLPIRSPTPNFNSINKVGVELDHRINCVQRSGNLIWIGTQDSRIAVFDFFKINALEPIAELELDFMHVKSIIIKDGIAFYKVINQNKKEDNKKENKLKSSGTHVIMWSPIFNSFNTLESSSSFYSI
jgi:hypothetical protein